MSKWLIPFFILFCAGTCSLSAQQLTRSPYSRYGVGEVLENSTTRNAAMGGIGVATGNLFSINRVNPASYADLVFTTMDIAGFGQFSRLKNRETSENQVTAGFQNISFGFASQSNFTFTFGFSPYSAVGYEIFVFDQVPLADTLADSFVNYIGDGGINQAFIGAATRLFKQKVRVGINAGYSFGNTRYRTQSYVNTNDNTSPSIQYSEEIFVGGFNGQWGIIYADTLKRKNARSSPVTLRLGLTGEHVFNLNGTQEQVLNSLIGDNVITSDTLKDNEGTIEIPAKFGLGVSLSKYGKWALGADLTYQNWGSFTYFGDPTALGNEVRFGIGGEYVPDIESYNYFERIHLRLGAYYKNSYIDFQGENIQDYGLTFGVGLPAAAKASDRFNPGRTTSKINLSFALGKRGTLSSALPLEELYMRVRLGITLNDTWFIRRVID